MMIDFQQGTAQPPIPVLPGEPGAATSAAAGQGAGATAGQTPSAATSTSQDGLTTTIPMTSEAMCTLRDQRSELSDQLISARNRREDLAEQAQQSGVVNREGLEAQVRLLDERILGIESEIARTGELVAASPVACTSDTPFPPFENMRPDITAIAIVFTIFVLTPIAIAMSRLLWKRGSLKRQAPTPIEQDNADRLQRLEHAVDSIAIEMERVSEGQRFVTRLLAESPERAKVAAPRG